MPGASANRRFADVRRYGEVDSTNRIAADLARQGAPDGTVVVAAHQTAGRGRRGRQWEAPPGSSLLVSVLIRLPPSTPPARASIAMGLAAADACAEVAAVDARLKWPNDVVVDGAKLGGILGEVVDDFSPVVVGLGLNVNWGGIDPPAGGTSLDRRTGGPVDETRLLDALLADLQYRLAQSPEDLTGDFRARCTTLGHRVGVDLAAGAIEGEAVDVTNAGHLVVAGADGVRHVIAAGDVVHLRPRPQDS